MEGTLFKSIENTAANKGIGPTIVRWVPKSKVLSANLGNSTANVLAMKELRPERSTLTYTVVIRCKQRRFVKSCK